MDTEDYVDLGDMNEEPPMEETAAEPQEYLEEMDLLDIEDDEDENVTKEFLTTDYLTKYERARVLGSRALQISQGSPIMVDAEQETDPLQLAIKELRERKIPLAIRRYLPDGSYEDRNVNTLLALDAFK
eukprot:TRINITY_DN1810_c0_g1_i1.p1 TRINITY_DN1810_c0_g1~~TRINITY_DN1810_c0_g1_i1.p1  ORF type:complete len:145 (-),score=39.80 TRINITY_DN1810_c0_g1_i1:108-494(-)